MTAQKDTIVQGKLFQVQALELTSEQNSLAQLEPLELLPEVLVKMTAVLVLLEITVQLDLLVKFQLHQEVQSQIPMFLTGRTICVQRELINQLWELQLDVLIALD